METEDRPSRPAEEKLLRGIVVLNVKVMGLALGTIFGLIIFVATNWLVIRGGDQVGKHLSLLANYFIGYRVSVLGSFIGFAYGFALGTFCGGVIGWIYNRIAGLRR